MKFDLDSMSEDGLRELNRQVVERLKLMSSMKSQMRLMAFKVGDRVSFEGNDGPIFGIITRINHKTASITTDSGHGWRVAPSLLMKVVQKSNNVSQGTLFHFQPKVSGNL